MNLPNRVQRYTSSERLNHWIVAIAFILAALSGLAMFHPTLFWLSNMFGGGPWTRVLHPFIGVVMFAAFVWIMLRFWSHNKWSSAPAMVETVARSGSTRTNCRVGRYKAGKKVCSG